MYVFLPAELLAEAFPEKLRDDAMEAAQHVLRHLEAAQWTERFTALVEGRSVHIPARLRFKRRLDPEHPNGPARLMARCLETRSNDGFQRQAALRDLLGEPTPWAAPFIVTLMGEWVVEILEDIDAAASPPLMQSLGEFVRENPSFWNLTRQRIASYWNVYYQHIPRADYVGFRLAKRVAGRLGP